MSEVTEPMTGRRLILNDDTCIEDGAAGYADGRLWCWITGFTMQQAAQIFFDTEKTSRIDFQYGSMTDTYDGYTNPVNLFIDNGGKISVCLTKGG